MKWQVRLAGQQHDLAELSRSLCSETLSLVKDEHGQYYLASTKFDSCGTPDEVLTVSKQLLAVLNGATKLALGGNLGLSESGVLEQKADDTNTFHMFFSDTINVRASFDLSITDVDGNIIEEYKPADPVLKWVTAGLMDDSVGKVFRLFGQEHNWVELYRIFEVIESDVGGIDEIATIGWAQKGQLKIFKHTANSPGAVGDDARHGKETTEPPKNPMLISEARALIQTLIHHWLRSKGFS
ncbi:hypothetical protein LH428_08605 [Laribacter hongkongensis]|uniref:hypothetical protein n=1 Tax=Laribacter hongkongensis TaxID=168471 RepID=UPI001EFE9938|nr:hypothetical protein [Laribacter hongkongensis]MCG9115908.1 hypothetical protein [Laribacter hongkongensis]